MEFIIELILEIFGAVLESADELYDVDHKGRKWKVLTHTLSIIKIIFFGALTLIVLLLGIFSLLDSTEGNSVVWAIICFLLTILFAYVTRNSVKAYKKWKDKINATITEKKEQMLNNMTNEFSAQSNTENTENVANSEEAFNEWLYGDKR